MSNNTRQFAAFTSRDAGRIAFALYGLRAEARALPGELDHNFYLRGADGQEFVLKIAHAQQPAGELDLQNRALGHLATHVPSLPLPRLRATASGAAIGTATDPDGSPHCVRLLTYVPGRPLAEFRPHTPELLRELGTMLGRLDAALQGFTHAAAPRALKWDLRRTLWIRDYIGYIEQPVRRSRIEARLSHFEKQVLPTLHELRRSVIHNDANDHNVLVDRAGVCVSIIDFGDMLSTCTVCEIAVAAAYAMLGKADPLSAAAQVVAGYHAAFPLNEMELEVLFPLICARLCISVVNSAYQREVQPDNAYLTISEGPAWALLDRLEKVHPRLAHYTLRHACGLVPCPGSGELVEWLTEHAGSLGSVVETDLRVARKVVFDLGVASRELDDVQRLADLDCFNRHIFGRMRAAACAVGIGRYNEVRQVYSGDAYRIEGNDGPEWRTVHLGLDIFMQPGSPVLAPLDGVVHSFRDNASPLDYGPTIILQHTVDDGRLTFFTLYGHLGREALEGLQAGKLIAKGSPFASIGDEQVNGGWPAHLHFQIISDVLDQAGDFPGVALPGQRAVRLSLSPDPNLVARIPELCSPAHAMRAEQILQARARHVGRSLSIAYRRPLTIVRGWRQYLYDEEGQPYLDAVNNVSHVGHCHPRVVKAGQEQMALLNTNTRYLHEGLVRYAERLCATLPEPLSVCFFVCSGSEANELALRLARAHTRRRDIVVVDNAYHGNTTALVEISPYKFDGPGGGGAEPYVHTVPLPDVYRGRYKASDGHAGARYARFVAQAVEERRGDVAAFICESLPGCGGQIVLPPDYLAQAYRSVREAGAVCIADEVQVGFGRAGTHFWCFETQGVIPDIVTMGKPIGNGHPLAAVVTTPAIAASFDNGMEYFNTFGGNPVSCAIGLAVLDVIADERLQENALRVGARLLDGLRALMSRHSIIGDVRGLGLFVGVELVLDRRTLAAAAPQAAYIANRMRARGILLSTDGPLHNVLKIKPPLVFSAADVDLLLATLDDVLGEDGARA